MYLVEHIIFYCSILSAAAIFSVVYSTKCGRNELVKVDELELAKLDIGIK